MNQQALNNNFTNTLFEHDASIEKLATRISKLETCLTIADENESCQSVSGGTHAEHLEARIKVLKEEREDNYKEIVELKKKLADAEAHGSNWKSGCESAQSRLAEAERQRDAFECESNDQAKAWKEIHAFIPDFNGLSPVEMLRHHVQQLQRRVDYEKTRADGNWNFCEKAKAELEFLKANNRYQTGFEDGANATIRQVREMAAKLKP